MADTPLGELRRAPRPIEQRIERLARWRAQGLDAGVSDAPFPADVGDSAAFASGGDTGGGEAAAALPEWWFDAFDVTSVSAATFSLTKYPVDNSEVVRLNGVVLEPTIDYTIASNVVTLTDLSGTILGIGAATWRLVVSYAYVGEVADATAVDESVVALSPWAYWRLNDTDVDGSGEYDMLDSSGNGRHAYWPISVAATLGQPPLRAGLSGSLYLDGTADQRMYADLGDVGDLEAAYTVTAWCKPESLTAALGFPIIVRTGDDSGESLFNIAINGGAFYNGTDFAGGFQSISGGAPVVDSTYFVASTWDGTDVKLFVDNVLVDSYTPALPPSNVTRSQLCFFGRHPTIGSGSYWTGYVSDIAIWDRSLTTDELTAVFTNGIGDPAIAVSEGTYTPPADPGPPGSALLSWEPPDTTGYASLDVSAGGTFTLDDDTDYVLTCPTAISHDPLTLVGGRNIVWIGGVIEGGASVPTGSFDSTHRGIRIKDGANPFLKRLIFIEGLYFRSGYFSDCIQIALRTENATTVILQNIRSDATNIGTKAGVHADFLQCWGGPRTLLVDGITASDMRYQGLYLDPSDGRTEPSGAGLDWVFRRMNLEAGTGCRYLLANRRPSFTNITCDDVYIDGSPYDNTDSFGNWPSTGLTQNATTTDFVSAALWTGDTYTSPGYL